MIELNDFIKAIKESKPKTSAYDTTAVVRRIEGNTAWVHIPGGTDETPVNLTIAAKEGDTVQVRIANGTAFLVGNATAPPTDNTLAVHVEHNLNIVEKVVSKVKAVAEKAATIAGNTNQYFWFTEEGTDTGAHITEIPQEEFLDDPDNGGGNLLARSNGVAIRNGLSELATFGAELVELGKNSVSAIIKMCADKLTVTASWAGASISTENEYTAGDPGTFYSILSIIARHIYETDSAAATISLWAGLAGQASRVNYTADEHIFDGVITLGSATISDFAHILKYSTETITDANSTSQNSVIRLANSHGVSNTPITNACFLITIGSNANNKVQFCTAANVSTFDLHMRKCSSGSWGSWKKVTFS